MPFINDELSAAAKGGTELMKLALRRKLIQSGHKDLFDFVDIYPSRVRNFNPDRPRIYWAHDLAGDPEANHLKADKGTRWDAIVFVSHWQQQQYMERYNLNGENTHVLGNAIEPFKPSTQKWESPLGTAENPVRLIYHTTPHRGLEILITVFEHLYNQTLENGIHVVLDVYSSFSIYGWAVRDEPYAEIFERCRNHPAINYHGAVSNEQVREALLESHIFAFPSIWPETSCIAMIEAMAAGNLVVHSNLAALPETAGGATVCYPFIQNPSQHAGRFYGHLSQAVDSCVKNPMMVKQFVQSSTARANSLYNWDVRLNEWISLLSSIKTDVEQRES